MLSKGVTAGSTTSERAAFTAQLACAELVARLRPVKDSLVAGKAAAAAAAAAGPDTAAAETGAAVAVSWAEVCAAATARSVCTTAHVSHNFAGGYAAFSAAVTEVELDALTGEMVVLASHIVYDCARSLNPAVDIGQVCAPRRARSAVTVSAWCGGVAACWGG